MAGATRAGGIDGHLPVAAIPEAPVWLALLGGLAALRLRVAQNRK